MGGEREIIVITMETEPRLPLIVCFTHSFADLIICASFYPCDHPVIEILNSFLL